MDRWSFRILVVLGGLGLLDAAYLTWMKISDNLSLCQGFGQCDVVNSSPYAEIYGIPIALIGAIAYAVMLAALAVEARAREPRWRMGARYALFILTTTGVLYSAYLTYIEVAVLHAICPFCVISAVILLCMWILAIIRLLWLPLPQGAAASSQEEVG